jgi:hypothetical protein
MGLARKLFGPSKQGIWKQLAAETGAQYVDRGLWKGDKVQATHGEWTMTLDSYSQTVPTGKTHTVIQYTRMRAPYINQDGFRFTIYRRGVFSGLAALMGMQDVEVGYPEVDRDFVIKGNDDLKLRVLFSNARIRELLSAQPTVQFSVRDDEGWFGAKFPEGVDELHFVIAGVVTDVERLKLLFELFAETLDHLCLMGSTYEEGPDVEL